VTWRISEDKGKRGLSLRPQMRKRGVFAAACATVLGALIAMPVHGADEKSVLPPRPDNAAINYLLAAAQIVRPQTDADVKALDFIEEDFQRLPPAALKARPDAVEIFLREGGVIRDIHRGAGKPKCQFDVDWEEGPEAFMPPLPLMRNLARQATAVARHQEFTGHPEEAATVYADVAQMSAHIAQEPTVLSKLVAAAVNNMNIHAVEGFLARDPPPEAVEQLMAGLARVPDHPFHIDRGLLGDGERFGDWFLRHPRGFVTLGIKNPADADDLIMKYYENIEFFDALDRELSSKPGPTQSELYYKSPEALAVLQAAVEEYRENLRKLAALAREPYFKSGEAFAALQAAIDKRLEEMKVETAAAMQASIEKRLGEMMADLAKGNPLLLLLAEGRRAYLVCNMSEAQLGMLRIMVAAAMHKAEKGAYPDTLEELAGYFPAGASKDPFTGKDFLYRLKDGLPAIECNPPESVRSADWYKAESASLDLGRRRQKDAEALKNFLEKRAAQ